MNTLKTIIFSILRKQIVVTKSDVKKIKSYKNKEKNSQSCQCGAFN